MKEAQAVWVGATEGRAGLEAARVGRASQAVPVSWAATAGLAVNLEAVWAPECRLGPPVGSEQPRATCPCPSDLCWPRPVRRATAHLERGLACLWVQSDSFLGAQ